MAPRLGSHLPKRSLLAAAAFVGQRFGGRVVMAIGPVIKGYQMWWTRCDCGRYLLVSAVSMHKGECLRCRHCQVHDQEAHRSRCWRGGVHVPMTLYNRWLRSAVRRGFEWSISMADLDALIVQQGWTCAMSGDQLIFNFGYENRGDGNASLDRIDSRRGYVSGNIQFVTKAVNFAKQANTDADFIELCRKVARHADVKRFSAETASIFERGRDDAQQPSSERQAELVTAV